MPTLSQGDIFEAIIGRAPRHDMAMVFGHIGFNTFKVTWEKFRSKHLAGHILCDVQDPFSNINQPCRMPFGGTLLWFIGSSLNNGMSDDDFRAALDTAFAYAASQKFSSLITNGVRNIDHSLNTQANRASDEDRARLTISYVTDVERRTRSRVELISLNDIFLR